MKEHEFIIKGIGKHLGYPECCIDWFIKHRLNPQVPEELNADQDKLHKNKGFIPCPACAQKVIERGSTLAMLINDRKHKFPYPKDDADVLYRLSLKLKEEYYGKDR